MDVDDEFLSRRGFLEISEFLAVASGGGALLLPAAQVNGELGDEPPEFVPAATDAPVVTAWDTSATKPDRGTRPYR